MYSTCLSISRVVSMMSVFICVTNSIAFRRSYAIYALYLLPSSGSAALLEPLQPVFEAIVPTDTDALRQLIHDAECATEAAQHGVIRVPPVRSS